jgi:hypothetical protein
VRRLPDDPVKRRLQLFKRCYQHLEHFNALIETGEMELPGIVTIYDEILPTEEIYLPDMMVGIQSLPDRQRQAFELICLQGFTERACTDIMFSPESEWTTPVQQYADTALARMVQAYDDKQAGVWIPRVYVKRTKCTVEDPAEPVRELISA